jgi:hypothetical protein
LPGALFLVYQFSGKQVAGFGIAAIKRFCGQHLNGNFAACYHALRLFMVLLVADFNHSRKVLATGCFTVIHWRLAGISLLLIVTYARTSTFYSS